MNHQGDQDDKKPGFWSLDHLVRRSRKALGPCLVLPWDSSTASCSAVGFQVLAEVALARGFTGDDRPKGLDIYRVEGNTASVAGVPVNTADRKNLEIRWVKRGTRINVNLKKILSVHPFSVPHGSRAQIPISKAELPEIGTCLVIHFNRAEFVP